MEKHSFAIDFSKITFYGRDKFVKILKRSVILILMFLVGCTVIFSPFLGIVIFVISLFLICTYIKPLFGFYFCVTLAPITSMVIKHYSTTTKASNCYPLSFLPIILTFIILMLRHAISYEKEYKHDYGIYFFPSVLITWAMISMLWSMDLYHGINTIFNMSVGIAFFILLNNLIVDKNDLKKMLCYLVFLSLFLAFTTLLSKFMVLGFNIEIIPRFSLVAALLVVVEEMRPGGFAHTSLASATLVFFIFMVIAIYPQVRGYRRILLVLLGTFLLFNVLLTASKAAMASFMVGIFFLLLCNPILRKRLISWSFLVITVVVGLYMVVFVFYSRGRVIGGHGSAAMAMGSLTTRVEYWEAGFGMLENRWLGAGAGGFIKVIDPVPEAHSTYFAILFDFGIVGFTIFALFIMEAALRLRKAIKECRDESMIWILYCLSASFIALVIHSLVNDFHYYNHFWLVMGLIFVVTRIAMETSNESLPPAPNR